MDQIFKSKMNRGVNGIVTAPGVKGTPGATFNWLARLIKKHL